VTLTWSPRHRQVGLLDALGLAAWVGFAVARWVPVARLPFWGCTLRRTTGWPCPGCGLTRVADRLSHGNVAGAFEANPLGAVAGLLMAGLACWTLLHMVLALPTPSLSLTEREARWARRGLVAAVLVNYAVVILSTRFPHLLHG